MIYQITERFGWFNCIAALLGLAGAAIYAPLFEQTTESLVMLLILQLLIGTSMVYASRQKRAGTDIGEKAYPATLVAYLLLALIVWRWFYPV
jgi:hypothetical protein